MTAPTPASSRLLRASLFVALLLGLVALIWFEPGMTEPLRAEVNHSTELGWQLKVEGLRPCALELGPGCSHPVAEASSQESMKLTWSARGREWSATIGVEDLPASSQAGLLLLPNGMFRQLDRDVPTQASEWTGEVIPGEQVQVIVYKNTSRTLPFVAVELLVNGEPLASNRRDFTRESDDGWTLIEVLSPDHLYGVTVQGSGVIGGQIPFFEHAIKGYNQGTQLSPGASSSFGGGVAVAAVTSAY